MEKLSLSGLPLIGPHVDRELELMLAGRKPMASFSLEPGMAPEYTGEAFEPYVQSGMFVKFVCLGRPPVLEHRWYCLKGEEWRGRLAQALHAMISDGIKIGNLDERDLHAITGHLLGYPADCVKHFITTNFDD